MGRFSVTGNQATDWKPMLEELSDVPDIAKVRGLLNAFEATRGDSLGLSHHLRQDKTPYEMLVIDAYTERRYRIGYKNSWVADDTRWLFLKDTTQPKKYRRLFSFPNNSEYISYTVNLDKALETVTYFLEHGTVNLADTWYVYGQPTLRLTKARFKPYQDSE